MNEEQFTTQVLDLMRMSGWICSHNRGDMRSRIQGIAGMPDLIAVKEQTGRLIFAELKSSKGRLSPLQQRWLAALRKSGAEVYVWRPEDMPAIIVTLTSTQEGVSWPT